MKKIVNIGLIGMGTVGAGVVDILQKKYSFIEDKVGTQIRLKRICDKKFEKKKPSGIDYSLLTTDISEVINDPEII